MRARLKEWVMCYFWSIVFYFLACYTYTLGSLGVRFAPGHSCHACNSQMSHYAKHSCRSCYAVAKLPLQYSFSTITRFTLDLLVVAATYLQLYQPSSPKLVFVHNSIVCAMCTIEIEKPSLSVCEYPLLILQAIL